MEVVISNRFVNISAAALSQLSFDAVVIEASTADGGLTFDEIAEAQGISVITAKRYAVYAEAWLSEA